MKKFDLVCDNDDLRPNLNYVKINKEHVVSTNGLILMWDKPENNFNEEFCEIIGENEFFIHSEDWKKFDKSELIQFKDGSFDSGIIEIHYKSKRKVLIEIELEKSVGKYPHWEQVVPFDVTPVDLNTIGINPKHYATIIKALGLEVGFKLQFTGPHKAIKIVINDVDYNDTGAIIMPYSTS